MKKVFCDFCGEEVWVWNKIVFDYNLNKRVTGKCKETTNYGMPFTKTFDVCEDCFVKLQGVVNKCFKKQNLKKQKPL